MNHFYQNIGEDWFTYPIFYSNMVKKYERGNFAEIGSWKGRSASFLAVEIHNSEKNIKLYCIDTWEGSDEHKESDVIINGDLYDCFIKNTFSVNHIITPVRKTSIEASKDFSDEYFEFIFIDASHKYDDVINDLNAWYPKLKKGGIFAGHDYSVGWIEVVNAVNDWTRQNNISLDLAGEEYVWAFTKK